MASIGAILAFITIIGNVLFPICGAVDPDCDYYQYIKVNQQFYIYNSEYPNYYGRNVNCRWIAEGEPGTQIELSCSDVQIPPSQNCIEDHLAIDLNGDTSLSNAPTYCGTGTLHMISEENVLTVGLRSTSFTRGGRFYCAVTAIPSTKPPPPKCDCGYRQERRIVGGVETGVNEFPYMSGIVDMENRIIRCGSSIISKRYAISAAHCFNGKNTSNLALVVGEHDVSTGTETSYSRIYLLSNIIVNTNYNESADYTMYDVALVKTQQDIVFSIAVGPVCLPFKFYYQSFAGDVATILGWGTTEFSGPVSDVLLKANVTVYSNTDCRHSIIDLLPNQMCTSTYKTDACQYDSGGPVIFADPNTRRDFLVGTISFGKGCASDFPSVNSRITSFLDWIKDQTPDADYCYK
ncbi:PREDICTED: venom serine protease 34-like [Nicrophorus vespilloides]|uniref:Venom serine protease 34-like n=1 Tax=Nicrophorus vespilloides TaxID=110193 RepID=A0ABM1MI28_NICVS|nr:PREDICTED: venom serine protease 34-like [Nicrophorus vespilloides]